MIQQMGERKIIGGEKMKGEREGDKDAKDEGRKQWKTSESKTKVQTGTGGGSERVTAGDGRFGSGCRDKCGEKKADRCLAAEQRCLILV